MGSYDDSIVVGHVLYAGNFPIVPPDECWIPAKTDPVKLSIVPIGGIHIFIGETVDSAGTSAMLDERKEAANFMDNFLKRERQVDESLAKVKQLRKHWEDNITEAQQEADRIWREAVAPRKITFATPTEQQSFSTPKDNMKKATEILKKKDEEIDIDYVRMLVASAMKQQSKADTSRRLESYPDHCISTAQKDAHDNRHRDDESRTGSSERRRKTREHPNPIPVPSKTPPSDPRKGKDARYTESERRNPVGADTRSATRSLAEAGTTKAASAMVKAAVEAGVSIAKGEENQKAAGRGRIGPRRMIREEPKPRMNLKPPGNLKNYDGTERTDTWIEDYYNAVTFAGGTPNIACRMLQLYLVGPARIWLSDLEKNSIFCWFDLKIAFEKHFRGTYKRPATTSDLQACIQKKGETSRNFLTRWLATRNECENVDNTTAMHAFIGGLQRGGLLRHKLTYLDNANKLTLDDMITIASDHTAADDDAGGDLAATAIPLHQQKKNRDNGNSSGSKRKIPPMTRRVADLKWSPWISSAEVKEAEEATVAEAEPAGASSVVVPFKGSYHVIFGRPTYHKFHARACYIYNKLKIPGPNAISRFVSRLGEKALPLYKLLKKTDKFVWDDAADASLNGLKDILTSPPILAALEESEPMLLYLVATNRVISLAIVVERKEEGSRKLRHYFQEHPVTVVSKAPLSTILNNADATGRTAKWGIELSAFDINYKARTAIKSQILADFVADWTEAPDANLEPKPETWVMHFDGSKQHQGSGAGVTLKSLSEKNCSAFSVHLSYK
ncbi:hypothetical protein QYE76_032698 [Lolium multiflorum]|uniref:Retrotransposon gag domain-containing protein n=1 Tax=Lolium multiflorum TaxID=4521 RepID=A0AAD8QV85_LOLMU|nr:hypothetical protein QYE76_032698 [Lolium multiflorum]